MPESMGIDVTDNMMNMDIAQWLASCLQRHQGCMNNSARSTTCLRRYITRSGVARGSAEATNGAYETSAVSVGNRPADEN
jgi:hypothetical protein